MCHYRCHQWAWGDHGLNMQEEKLKQQFRQYLLIGGVPNLVSTVVLLALYAIYGNYLLLLWGLATTLNAVLYSVAYRRVNHHSVASSAPIICCGMWALAVLGATTAERALPVTILMGLLPVIALMPYVPMRTLLRISLAAAGILTLGCLYVGAGLSINNAKNIPDVVFMPLVNWGTVLAVSIGSLSLWHNSRSLKQAAGNMQRSNQALAESGRQLEGRVLLRQNELQAARTEILAARDTALASSRHKSVFLANMSHELRTPLNAILGFSEALHSQMFGTLAEKQMEYIGDIHDSGAHLLSLINNILDLAKIEAGQYELNFHTTNLADIFRQATDATQKKWMDKELTVETSVDPALGDVSLDPSALRKILHNLMDNAIKASPQGGHIWLEAKPTPDHFEISIRDAGPGIAPDQVEAIFEPFRSSQGAENAHTSMGLGLSLCRALVELHNGQIQVDLDNRAGARFVLEFPMRAAA